MKKTFTILIAAFFAIFLITQSFTAKGQAKPDPTYEWVLTDFEDLTTNDIFVIVGTKSSTNYALEANGASKPKATSITIANSKITSTVQDAYQWKLVATNTTGRYYITTNANTPKYLYNTKSSGKYSTGLSANGSNSSDGNVFVYTEYTNTSTSAKTNMLQVVASSRYVCIYSTDWRAYTSGTNTDDNQTPTTFYKRQVASSDPTVTVSPTSLSGFSYVYGEGPSTQEKSISVSGSNLSTNNLVVTASSNYEVCKTINGDYSTSVEFEPTTGVVSASTVYVRLKAGLSAGSYNSADDKLTISSSGATSQTVALSGTVIPKYTLTILATNGHIEDGDGITLTTGSVAQGAEIEVTAVPSSVNYKFTSWSVTGDGSSVESTTTNPTTFTMGSANATLTANFEEITTYAIQWSVNGVVQKTDYVEEDKAISFPSSITGIPTGYVLRGWVVEKNKILTVTNEDPSANYVTSATSTEDFTYYAVMAAVTYTPTTVTLNASGMSTAGYGTGTRNDDEGNSWSYYAAINNTSSTMNFGLNSNANNYNIGSPSFSGNITAISMRVLNGSSKSVHQIQLLSHLAETLRLYPYLKVHHLTLIVQ